MSYLGKVELKASNVKRWTGTPGAVSTILHTTLGFTPLNEQSTIITVNGVKQHNSAYTLSSTAINFTASLAATDEVEVIGILEVGTAMVPGDDVVDETHLKTTGTPDGTKFLRDDFTWTNDSTHLPLTGGTMTGTIAGFTSTGIDDNATSTVITIDSNVGIGTSSPSAGLDVEVNSTVWATEINQTNTSNGDGLFVNIGSTSVSDYVTAFRSNNVNRFVVKGDGNVGIGTSSPAGLLHVDGHTGSNRTIFEANGNGDEVGVQLKIKANNGSTSTPGLYGSAGSTSTDNTITLGPSSTSGVKVDSSGDAQFQGAITEKETVKTASFTPNLSTDGTIFDVSGTITITMPSATAGKSFTIIDSGSGTLSWAGTIKWNGGAAPSPSGITIYSFISNGTDWYGMQAGTGFA